MFQKIPGVLKYISAKDIPGENNFVAGVFHGKEKIFCEEDVEYAGQAVGMIIASKYNHCSNQGCINNA